MTQVAMSFSSSGMLFPYHLGVIEAVQALSPALDVREVHGVSGGALSGAIMLLGPECLERARRALEVRIRPTWGELWDPASLLPRLVQEHHLLPPDAHSVLSGRLHIYTTTGGMVRNTHQKVNSTFRNNDELLAWIQASCSFAWDGVKIDGVSHWDGGCCGSWAERSETFPTIVSSVISMQGAEICPQPRRVGCNIGRFRVDGHSLRSGWDCCFMFAPQRLSMYWQSGRVDAQTFFAQQFAECKLPPVAMSGQQQLPSEPQAEAQGA